MAAPVGREDRLKAFLLKTSGKSNMNLYDHLTCLLTKVMDERPHNVVDVIENLSYDLKQGSFKKIESTLCNLPHTSSAELLTEQQRQLFSSDDTVLENEKVETVLPNVNEIGFYLEQAEVGLSREEMQRIFLALKRLVELEALPHCRLWGKILGTESNYIVAEAEQRDREDQSTEEALKEEEEEFQDNDMMERDSLPRSLYKSPPAVPKEAVGTGANKSVYYVCKEPGLPWVKLPSVSPAQITAACQIRKLFTGRLDNSIVSYPPFPGNEANYLRAQIARISAGTQVSPLGFYQTGEEEDDDDEDEAPQDRYEVNPYFEGIPVSELVDSLSTWVHHVQHILQQGRCIWVNPSVKPEEDVIDEEEPEDREQDPDEPEPEVGPPLLTLLSQDAEIFNTPPWFSELSSMFIPEHAIAVLCSNLWPGACAYACGKKSENIYIGWGLKDVGAGYNPPLPPFPQKEYPSGPEITEVLDPSLEEEQEEALEEQQAELENTLLQGEEEEEEEYDDD